MKLFLTAVACASSAISFAQDSSSASRYITLFYGRGFQVLGSEDVRQGGGISYAWGRPEPRFQIGHIPAELVYEGYYDHTRSWMNSGPSPDTDAVGFLAYARWMTRRTGTALYLDFGWGAQMADRKSYDLPSELNSTPFIGAGVRFPVGRYDGLVGLRFIHISNADTIQKNRGQDELFVTAGVRF